MESSKYARPELERRFLLGAIPEDARAAYRIVDRYLVGTRLRLRLMEPIGGAGEIRYKFALKDRPEPSDPSVVMITNLYLSPEEYSLLEQLPADVLTKTRHALPSAPSHAVDEFEGPLAGLVLLEVCFDTLESLQAFEPPAFAGPEVTADDRYSGGGLARLVSRGASQLLEETTELLA